MIKSDGGQAFPVPLAAGPNGMLHSGEIGMSLRDWFAGMALQGLLAAEPSNPKYIYEEGMPSVADGYAEQAYFMADAMLRARGEND